MWCTINSSFASELAKMASLNKSVTVNCFRYYHVKKNRLNGLTYDQILTYLKDTKKEERIEKYKALLKFRDIPFDADLFTWHNEDIN